ncbi:MAG TPA: molybdenum cofactor guanylyltransferase [Methanothermobacter sp.]|jgi:molybdopterin-guanine dinucleotide biosynthesis protein A|uniref:Molybdenum cofactor guanylyltransferase n=2 Tax=Methanothermobacter tenebrarum TaxID=680118 RepID=A0ABN6PDQ3_9EURY|nr:molybdenum cofactor guanylyltransferase [Methanothermobacter tenebrarum]HHW16132.1 molybdenum cofactor guanylyltransferase [Methanothermobacter sp.]
MGRDKGLIILEGKPLIARILDKIKPYFDEIFIILRDEQQKKEYLKLFKEEKVKILTDIIKGKGPLGGLLTGLLNIKSEYALVLPCDSPFITREFIENCLKMDMGDYDAIIPVWGDGKLEPLHGVYNQRVAERIHKLLLWDERRVNTLAKIIRSRLVPVEELDPSLESFRNVNRPEDLRI